MWIFNRTPTTTNQCLSNPAQKNNYCGVKMLICDVLSLDASALRCSNQLTRAQLLYACPAFIPLPSSYMGAQILYACPALIRVPSSYMRAQLLYACPALIRVPSSYTCAQVFYPCPVLIHLPGSYTFLSFFSNFLFRFK